MFVFSRDKPKLVFFDLTTCIGDTATIASQLFSYSCPTPQVRHDDNCQLLHVFFNYLTPCLLQLPYSMSSSTTLLHVFFGLPTLPL